MDDVVYQCAGLDDADIALLERVEAGIGILADINRADVLVYSPLTADRMAVVAHSRPHSVAPVYGDLLLGTWANEEQQPLMFRTLRQGWPFQGHRAAVGNGAPIIRQALPIRNGRGRIISALCIETNLIEHERHRRRSVIFQWAVSRLQQMAARGDLSDAQALTSFGEHDGVLVVDRLYRIRYASGIATNLYRHLGIVQGLVGSSLYEIGTNDAEIVAQVFDGSRCVQQETSEGGRHWIKGGVPVLAAFGGWNWFSGLEPLLSSRLERRVVASLVLVSDTTESVLREQEMKVKTAMIREVHHRVKNNLQTIAALLRMQARRSNSEDVRQALQEGINRILSVAVVHEFQAHQETRQISLMEVVNKIIRQIRQGMIDPEKRITVDLVGEDIALPAQHATSCALIVNELLLNAIEHGFEGKSNGAIRVELGHTDSMVTVTVEDDGSGLPKDFDVEHAESLGLQIVRTLVQDDLKGSFELENNAAGARATISFPQNLSGGD